MFICKNANTGSYLVSVEYKPNDKDFKDKKVKTTKDPEKAKAFNDYIKAAQECAPIPVFDPVESHGELVMRIVELKKTIQKLKENK